MKKYLCILLSASLLLSVCGAYAADVAVTDPGFEVRTEESGFVVSNPLYRLSTGGVVTSLIAGAAIKVLVKVKNTASNALPVTVITGLYNGAHTMEAVSFDERVLNGGAEAELAVNLSLPSTVTAAHYLVTYVWDGGWAYNESFRFPYPKTKLVESAWNYSGASFDAPGTGSFYMTSDDSREGVSALKVEGKNSKDKMWQDVTVPTGGHLRMSFYAKGTSGFDYRVTDSSGNTKLSADAVSVETFPGSADWNYYSCAFKPGTNSKVKLCFTDAHASGASLIDDVSVSDNMVANEGFEQGVAPWVIDGSCEVGADGLNPANNALVIRPHTAAQVVRQDVPVLKKSNYLLSFRVSPGESLTFRVVGADGATLLPNTNVAAGAGWRTVSADGFNAGDNQRVTVLFQTGASSGNTSYIDDVELKYTSTMNLLANAGFENGVTGWNGHSSARIDAVTDPVRSGSQAARVHSRQFPWNGLAQDVTSKLQENGPGTYYVEAWVRTNSPVGVTATIKFNINSEAKAIPGANATADSSGWVKLSAEIPLTWTGNCPTTIFYIEQNEHNPLPDLYIDDCVLNKVEK